MEDIEKRIGENLRKIILNRGLNAAEIGKNAGLEVLEFADVIAGTGNLTTAQLEKIASGLGMSVIDIITYPDRFIKI